MTQSGTPVTGGNGGDRTCASAGAGAGAGDAHVGSEGIVVSIGEGADVGDVGECAEAVSHSASTPTKHVPHLALIREAQCADSGTATFSKHDDKLLTELEAVYDDLHCQRKAMTKTLSWRGCDKGWVISLRIQVT